MKNIVISLGILLISILMFGCKKDGSKKDQANMYGTKYTSDSIYYDLNLGELSNVYLKKNGKYTFVVVKKIVVNGKDFGADNIDEALVFLKENKVLNDNYICEVINIGLRRTDGSFEIIWNWKNYITVNKFGYGKFNFSVYLDASNGEFNGLLQDRLHINFKTIDTDNGYKLYTLNYIYEDSNWVLVEREKINTIVSEFEHSETAYCTDTTNTRCIIRAKKFNLNYDYIFSLSDRVCY